MNQKTKKLIILNLPYAIIGLFCSNIGEAWRIAEGTDISTKLLGFFTSMGTAWGNPMPSFHPFDLCIGLAIGAAFRLVVYVRSKNARKYRHGEEYGSARWAALPGLPSRTPILLSAGAAESIEPIAFKKWRYYLGRFVFDLHGDGPREIL